MRDETKCLHSGYTPKNGEPRVLPIVQSTTYVYDSAAEVAAIFDDPTRGLCYSRFGNPTVMAVEEKIADPQLSADYQALTEATEELQALRALASATQIPPPCVQLSAVG